MSADLSELNRNWIDKEADRLLQSDWRKFKRRQASSLQNSDLELENIS
jgi:hypothetical protein